MGKIFKGNTSTKINVLILTSLISMEVSTQRAFLVSVSLQRVSLVIIAAISVYLW
jgi:hypothetical protein